MTSAFPDRLAALVEERRSQVVLGLDPDPAALWPAALEEELAGTGDAPGGVPERTARAVARHCRAAIEAAGPACVAVKLQAACFERLGAPGWAALAEACEAGRSAGLLVIADGKRGDVPHTAAAYAQALVGETPTPFGLVSGLGADAMTLNPLLGRDALAPLIDAARSRGAGSFVLVRTSNEGAAEIQDEAPAGSPPLRERLGRLVDALGAGGIAECGLADVGAVVAATEPELLAGLRDVMPRAVFLLPGVGAQGATPADVARAFTSGPASALVSVARDVIYAFRVSGMDWRSAAAAEASRYARETWAVSGW